MTKKRALGKGLSALLENANTDITTKNIGSEGKTVGSISSIAIEQIEANPFNPRTHFEEEQLEELKDSISVHGIIQPLTVRKLGRDKYQLISGERRFRASQLVGLTEVPCYIRIANDQTMLEMALVENIQRVDLNAIEVGLSYQRLIDECNFTQEQLSKKVGKSRSNIANFLRLLKLPAPIQIGIRESLISMGHARAIVSAGEEDVQIDIFRKIIEDELSVREVEALIKSQKAGMEEPKSAPKKETVLAENLVDFQNRLAEKLDTKVQIASNNKGKGKIVINFGSEEKLDQIIDFINQLDD
ncbi:ParB/RepB/Spo0J family partition protein [Crocinitomix algicola]|uniref:ParB/RepB/Spo0J family partition protein n=1 Tax=Crocinitomix algicola TaxID=1740263 RepID=UPI000872E1F4|nr:ParB/RepB/Spo0J family partition protein [Crocinitomix algicola]